MPLSKLSPQLLNQFQRKLGYDLIILHYGTNVLNYGTKNYNWYQRGMQKAISNLRAGFPGVPILVISAADKATKYDMEMRTDSAVVPLTLAQRKLAVETRSGFINLYELMGGSGSMVRWVEEVPALANKDYTHFNFRGAKKIATLFYQKLQSGFSTYKRLKSKVNTEAIVPENDSIPDEEL
jgi:lysophospholipase L1-like esterase